MSIKKFVKQVEDNKFKPYENIMLSNEEYSAFANLAGHSDIFNKLKNIAEYELAMKLAYKKITQAEFDGAMKFAKYLKFYFSNNK